MTTELTREQDVAITLVRDTLTEMPAVLRPELAASWWAHMRDVLQRVDVAFREEGPR